MQERRMQERNMSGRRTLEPVRLPRVPPLILALLPLHQPRGAEVEGQGWGRQLGPRAGPSTSRRHCCRCRWRRPWRRPPTLCWRRSLGRGARDGPSPSRGPGLLGAAQPAAEAARAGHHLDPAAGGAGLLAAAGAAPAAGGVTLLLPPDAGGEGGEGDRRAWGGGGGRRRVAGGGAAAAEGGVAVGWAAGEQRAPILLGGVVLAGARGVQGICGGVAGSNVAAGGASPASRRGAEGTASRPRSLQPLPPTLRLLLCVQRRGGPGSSSSSRLGRQRGGLLQHLEHGPGGGAALPVGTGARVQSCRLSKHLYTAGAVGPASVGGQVGRQAGW